MGHDPFIGAVLVSADFRACADMNSSYLVPTLAHLHFAMAFLALEFIPSRALLLVNHRVRGISVLWRFGCFGFVWPAANANLPVIAPV